MTAQTRFRTRIPAAIPTMEMMALMAANQFPVRGMRNLQPILILTGIKGCLFRTHVGKENDVSNGLIVGHEHDQPVDANTLSGRGGKTEF